MTYSSAYSVLASIGAGLAAGGLLYLAFKSIKRSFSPPKVKLPSFKMASGSTGLKADNRFLKFGATAGFLVGLILSWGTHYALFAAVVGGAIGVFAVETAARLRERSWVDARRQEIVVLFDTIELYMRAGMTAQHALAAAKVLTPNLRTAVNRALMYWPSGSAKALEILRREINLPEGEILVSLLNQIVQSGVENLEGVIRRESRRLEQMRDAAEKARITLKPLYLVLYRALPLVASLGMFAGALFMRVSMILKKAGLWN
ncbi:MAG: hypothetical protein PWQ39_154 [Thermacetogenium sp.]|nr:hypothetical protein [Thermacetogenium sp.]